MTQAATRKAPLTVITVNSVPASYWTGKPVPFAGDEEKIAEIRKAAEEKVAQIAASLGDSQPESVTVTALTGFPVQTLLDASKDADLVVVGSRGRGGFAELMLGSVSHQVVHHAHCPVVVVPAG